MKKTKSFLVTLLLIFAMSFVTSCKKDEDDTTQNLLLLLFLQQAAEQGAAQSRAATLAAHPGCNVLNTASTSSQIAQYALKTDGSTYVMNIEATMTSGQTLVITSTSGNLPLMDSVVGYDMSFYNSGACTSADFSDASSSASSNGISISDNASNRLQIQIAVPATYNYEIVVTDVVAAGGTITYQIQ